MKNVESYVNLLIIGFFLITFIVLLAKELLLRKNKSSFSGKPPINKYVYKIGKFSIWGTWVALVLQSLDVNLRLFQIMPILLYIVLFLVLFSFTLFITSFFYLGNSLRIGLPHEQTKLKTNGVYKISRNPIYVAFYCLAIASVFYTLNPIVLILAILGSFIHHKIILGEEKFLKKQFGQNYVDYMNEVRRYL